MDSTSLVLKKEACPRLCKEHKDDPKPTLLRKVSFSSNEREPVERPKVMPPVPSWQEDQRGNPRGSERD